MVKATLICCIFSIALIYVVVILWWSVKEYLMVVTLDIRPHVLKWVGVTLHIFLVWTVRQLRLTTLSPIPQIFKECLQSLVKRPHQKEDVNSCSSYVFFKGIGSLKPSGSDTQLFFAVICCYFWRTFNSSDKYTCTMFRKTILSLC